MSMTPKEIGTMARVVDSSPIPVPTDPLERKEEYISIVSKFTRTQRRFLSAYINFRTLKEACDYVGIDQHTPSYWEKTGVAWKRAFALATSDSLMAASELIEQAAVKAMQTMIDLLDSKDPKIRLSASTNLAKLLEASKTRQVQHTHTGDVTVNVDYKATLERLVDGEAKALGAEEDIIEAELREIPDEIED